MVKIKLKLLLMSAIMLLLILNIAHAAGSRLYISDVDVKVGGKTDNNLNDGDTIDREAKPGETVEIRVEVKNNFTSAENLKIEGITIKATLEAIDDGDDLEEDSSDFDLSAGRDKKVTLKFQVPMEVEETSYDVLIEAEGDDKNGTAQNAEMKLRLEVNKENHLLKITRVTLSPAEVACSRKNIQITAGLLNIGNEDEEDVTLQISNPSLSIDVNEAIPTLEATPNEPEARFTKTFNFNVPANAEAGSYPVAVKALYQDGRKRAEESATLTVIDCQVKKEATSGTPKVSEESDGVELITSPSSGTKTTPAASEPILPPGTVITQEGLFKSNTFIAGIIIAEVVVVLIGIVLIISLFRKRG